MACLNTHGSRAGGSVDVESITEASLRVATCSGALKLGKIKASSVDVDTAGEPHRCIHHQHVLTVRGFQVESHRCIHHQHVFTACGFQVHAIFECMSPRGFAWVGDCVGGGGGQSGAHSFRCKMPVWATLCRFAAAAAGLSLVSAEPPADDSPQTGHTRLCCCSESHCCIGVTCRSMTVVL